MAATRQVLARFLRKSLPYPFFCTTGTAAVLPACKNDEPLRGDDLSAVWVQDDALPTWIATLDAEGIDPANPQLRATNPERALALISHVLVPLRGCRAKGPLKLPSKKSPSPLVSS